MIKTITKYQEIIKFILFGLITIIINIITYSILTITILNPFNPLELEIANIISWITSITIAYINNRLFVFISKSRNIIKEIIKFYSARITILTIDMFLMYLFVTLLHYNNIISKIIVQIIITIPNYLINKKIVFNNK